MIARTTVTFGRLRQVLMDLGLAPIKRGKFWLFAHASSKAILIYRPYRARERVTVQDLHVTRHDLEWRELMTPEEFDYLLNQGNRSYATAKERRSMIAKSAIVFGELARLLSDLGFTQSKRGKFWHFEHPTSEAVFGFRPYRARERITLGDLQMTRHQLDLRGLLDQRAFDDRLRKVTA